MIPMPIIFPVPSGGGNGPDPTLRLVLVTFGGVLLFFWLLFSGMRGAIDAEHGSAGTSLIARAEQSMPTYWVMKFLADPHNQ